VIPRIAQGRCLVGKVMACNLEHNLTMWSSFLYYGRSFHRHWRLPITFHSCGAPHLKKIQSTHLTARCKSPSPAISTESIGPAPARSKSAAQTKLSGLSKRMQYSRVVTPQLHKYRSNIVDERIGGPMWVIPLPQYTHGGIYNQIWQKRRSK